MAYPDMHNPNDDKYPTGMECIPFHVAKDDKANTRHKEDDKPPRGTRL